MNFLKKEREGREEGKNIIIKKMLSMGQSLEFISQCTGQPVDYIRQMEKEEPMLVREAQSFATELRKTKKVPTNTYHKHQ